MIVRVGMLRSCRYYTEDELVYQFYAVVPSQGELSAFHGGVECTSLGGFRPRREGRNREQEDTVLFYDIVRIRKPWRTAHIDACDI